METQEECARGRPGHRGRSGTDRQYPGQRRAAKLGRGTHRNQGRVRLRGRWSPLLGGSASGKESSDSDESRQGELLPAFDLTQLPSLTIPRQFISKHANVADYAIARVSSKYSRRTYESRLRAVGQILGYEDLRQVPWENLRYEHVLQLREYLYKKCKRSYSSINATLSAIRAAAKERRVYPDGGTRAAIADWLTARGTFDGLLLLAVRKNGQIDYRNGRLSDQTIYDVIRKRSKHAGVSA